MITLLTVLLVISIFLQVKLTQRVFHLEKIVRRVEIQGNKNAININAHDFMFSSLPEGMIAKPDEAMQQDIESANAKYKGRIEYLESLGIAGEYMT